MVQRLSSRNAVLLRSMLTPNPLVNPTRNGMRQSAGKVCFAHSSSPAACRTPLRSGYQQR
jgi:hypothetical protein